MSFQNLLIISTPDPTPNERTDIGAAALRAYHLVSSNWRLICADRNGYEGAVISTALAWNMPLRVYGISARPVTAVQTKYYERLVIAGERWRRHIALDKALVDMAHKVVVVGELNPRGKAMLAYARLLHKNISLPTNLPARDYYIGAPSSPHLSLRPIEWVHLLEFGKTHY